MPREVPVDLLLVRHAIADTRDPAHWPDDRLRPLTEDGERRFRVAARGLRRIVPSVDVLLSSPLVRAWQTAELLASVAHWPAPKRFNALAPGHLPDQVLDALAPYSNSGSLGLVGHEPDLSELAAYLIGSRDGEARLEMKKGGAAQISFDGDLQTGLATLRWLMTPAILRALGS